MLDEMTPKIKAIQKMQDYIAAHQTEEINLSDLANGWHYSTLIKGMKGFKK